MNINIYTGRFTHDPELIKTYNGVSFTRFTLAVKRPYSRDKVDFIPCFAWEQRAETICKHFKKGSPILIHGHLESSNYDDKETGKKRTRFEVSCDSIEFFENSPKKDMEKQETTTEGSTAIDINDTEFFEQLGEGQLPF